ncbi:MAG: hypothetical protein JWO82_1274 [Akkermansiaceae bacterium]|nr:hypothetical protein [Akkermansiaceae bacterium]
MKFHAIVLLPLGLLLSSCFSDPYAQQQPPMNQNGQPYYPYGQNSGYQSPRPPQYDGYQTEQGSYEQVPQQGGPRPQNTAPPLDSTGRPIPPSYDPEEGGSAPAPAPTPSRPTYPTAQTTDKPGNVISPYPPYNVIDVSEIKSGHLAKDPSTGKTFRVP